MPMPAANQRGDLQPDNRDKDIASYPNSFMVIERSVTRRVVIICVKR